MKKSKALCVVAAAVCALACLAGCGSKKIEVEPIPSDTLFVEKVENLPEDFIPDSCRKLNQLHSCPCLG